jgi:hypothetical protein
VKKRTTQSAWWLSAILVVAFAAVSSTGGSDASPQKDLWYQAAPEGAREWKWAGVKKTEMALTTRQMWPKAKQMLQKVSIVKLKMTQAQALTGKRLSAPVGEIPYLVRALYLNEATGGFSVSFLENKLWVHHDCLGNHPIPMTRSALVVFLKTIPKQVYVTCSMDE